VSDAARFSPKKWPIQERARVTMDAMLTAAAHILEARGLAAVNTNIIAERAGVSIGSLYQYFPNKTALLTLVADRLRARLTDAVKGTAMAHEGAPFALMLREAMHAYGTELARGARLHEALFVPNAPWGHGDPDVAASIVELASRALAERVAEPRAKAGVLVTTLGAFAHATLAARPSHLVTKAFALQAEAIAEAVLAR
jgi:AcrR family transcriptional regulator